MKRFYMILALLVSVLAAKAEVIQVDGIWYDIKKETKVATVTKVNGVEYSGDIVIPESVIYEEVAYSVTSIGAYAFNECSILTSVTIPGSVTSIGENAFCDCSSLASVTIPGSVTSIETCAFAGCSSLTSVTIPNSVTSIGVSAFFGCSSLTSVTIPNSVTSIGECAFWDCFCLTSVTIPNSVTNIGGGAFYGCSSLTSVTIGNSVTRIESGAFRGCRLRTIISKGSGTSRQYGFDNATFNHATLYVPVNTYWDYVYGSWGDFIHIKEMEMEAANIKAETLYMLADENGCNYTVYDADTRKVRCIDYLHNVDEDSNGTYWQVMGSGNRKRLYNLGAKQYAAIDKDGHITLSSMPVELELQTTNEGITVNGSTFLFVRNQNEMVTPITEICEEKPHNENATYDLLGRKVTIDSPKGFYVKSGKKYIK